MGTLNEPLAPSPDFFLKRLGTALSHFFKIGKANFKSKEALVGWRILSAVDEIIPGKQAKARARNWESPYAPEMVRLEMMAQTAGLLVGSVRDFSGNVVFAKVESAEFTNELRTMDHEFLIEAVARDGVGEQGSWIETQIVCGGNKIASAKLFLIDAGDLNGTGKSLTFHAEFLNYYHVREKIVN